MASRSLTVNAQGHDGGAVNTMGCSPGWSCVPAFVLRLAGFPFALLEQFGFSQSLEAIKQSSCSISPDGSTPVALDSCFDSDMTRNLRLLESVVSDERFQEAIFISNPEASERLESHLSTAAGAARKRPSRFQRLAMTYLQRFAAKNDTSSFFGPSAYGRIVPARGPLLRATPQSKLNARRTSFSHWAAKELAGSRDVRIPTNTWTPLEYLSPELRSHSDVMRICETLRALGEATFSTRKELTTRINNHFTHITGKSPTRSPGMPYADRAIVSEDSHYAIPNLMISNGIVAGLTVEAAPVLNAVVYPAMFRQALSRHLLADLLRCRWGPNARVRYADVRREAGSDTATRRALQHSIEAEWRLRSAPFFSAVSSLIDGRDNETSTVALPSSAFEAVERTIEQDVVQGWPAIISADVLLASSSIEATNQNDYRLVLGEVHHSIGITGYYSQFCPFASELVDLVSTMLRTASNRQPVNLLSFAHNKTFVALDLPFPDIEYDGYALPGKTALTLDDLFIADRDGTASLQDASGRELFIYNKLPSVLGLFPLDLFCIAPCTMHGMTRAFTFRRRHVPRISLGRVVIQRQTWQLTTNELAIALNQRTPCQSFIASQRLRNRYGWPRFLFAKVDKEHKPLLVDFDNWLLLDVLRHQLRRVASTAVELSEMLPGPKDLWFSDKLGRHTSEFRITLCRHAV
jgi:hypothetical protein